MTSNDSTSPNPPNGKTRTTSPLAWLVAAGGSALEGGVLVAMAATALYTAATGSASTTTRAVTEAVMLLVLAGGLLVLAVSLLRRKSLAKTPTLLWNGMLVPVSFNLMGGGARGWGVAALAVAVVTFVASLVLPRYEPEDDDASAVS